MTHPARLDDLINHVRGMHPSGDPLEHLSSAVLVSEHLGELADHLVGHFVDQARKAGTSWTEIGQSIGVSKQAAQKRFVPKTSEEPELLDAGVFSRFTKETRHAVFQSQEEARRAQNQSIGTEHVVLGLLHEPECLAIKAIEAQAVSIGDLREALVAALGPAGEPISGHIPFTSEAKKLLELTVRESLRLGHHHIGTEHVLLGLLDHEEAAGAKVLAELGITKDRAEQWILAALREQKRAGEA
jgi:hypothetical protein